MRIQRLQTSVDCTLMLILPYFMQSFLHHNHGPLLTQHQTLSYWEFLSNQIKPSTPGERELTVTFYSQHPIPSRVDLTHSRRRLASLDPLVYPTHLPTRKRQSHLWPATPLSTHIGGWVYGPVSVAFFTVHHCPVSKVPTNTCKWIHGGHAYSLG